MWWQHCWRPRFETQTNRRGENPLHCAARGGSEKVVELLLADDPTLVESRDNFHLSALHVAAKIGRRDVVALLLAQCPALLQAEECYSRTALAYAIEGGYTHVVECLLAQTHKIEGNPEWSMLHLAADMGRSEIAEMVLAHSPHLASVKCGAHRKLALHVAVRRGHDAIVKQMLQVNPSLIDEVDGLQQTVIHASRAARPAPSIHRCSRL